jgi:hypothetical protein
MVIPPPPSKTLVGLAADGFTAPSYADYSPYIYVP